MNFVIKLFLDNLKHFLFCKLATVVEFGFQHNNYTISEQNLFNEAVICVLINEGLLEKNITVNLTITDETTEDIIILTPPYTCYIIHILNFFTWFFSIPLWT